MSLANIYTNPTAGAEPALRSRGMSEGKIAALYNMSRVPGMMDHLQSMFSSRPNMMRSWDPAEIQGLLNPNRYVNYNPSAGMAGDPFKLSGSMRRGADFTSDLRSWYGADDDAYAELMRDISAAEARGKPLGYHRDIDISRRKDQVDHATQYGTADLSQDMTKEALARSLAGFGIQDMQDIGVSRDADGNPVFYNQRTGQALPEQLFSVHSKKTVGDYGLDIDDEGNIIPTFESTFRATRHKRQKRNAMAIGALGALAAPWALGALGATAMGGALGSVGTGALYGAGVGAVSSGVGGGDPLKGALIGGVGGGVGAAAGGFSPIQGIESATLRNAAIGALRGGATGGLGAALYGGDALKGLAGGALVGGIGGAGAGAFGGDPNTAIGRLSGMAGGMFGSQVGQQLAGQLVGSPWGSPQRQQPAASAPTPSGPRVNLNALPEHARARIQGALSSMSYA